MEEIDFISPHSKVTPPTLYERGVRFLQGKKRRKGDSILAIPPWISYLPVTSVHGRVTVGVQWVAYTPSNRYIDQMPSDVTAPSLTCVSETSGGEIVKLSHLKGQDTNLLCIFHVNDWVSTSYYFNLNYLRGNGKLYIAILK